MKPVVLSMRNDYQDALPAPQRNFSPLRSSPQKIYAPNFTQTPNNYGDVGTLQAKSEVVRELLSRSIHKSEKSSKHVEREPSPQRVSSFELGGAYETISKPKNIRQTPMKQDDEDELIRYIKE